MLSTKDHGKNPLVRCNKRAHYEVTGASTVMGQNEENTLKYKFLLTIDADERNVVFGLKGFTHRYSKGKEKMNRMIVAVFITFVNRMRRYETS